MTKPARPQRRLALAATLATAILIASAPFRSGLPDTPGGGLALRARPVALNLEHAGAQQVGKLLWRGGLSLGAAHAAFGGWSDLWVAPDGGSLRAVSDEGSWFVARLLYDRSGHLAGLDDAQLGRMKGRDGAWLNGKRAADAESLAMLADGSMLVGFERQHRILHYPAGDERRGGGLAGRPLPFAAPPALAQAPANAGLEAIALLSDGRLFLLTEDYAAKPGTTAGWIGIMRGGAPAWSPFHYGVTEDFRPTSAAALPGGDVIVLERAASLPGGWRVRLTRLRGAALAPNATVRGEELARLATPWVTENLEGIAARPGPDGRTLLWLLSDDNFSSFQHTVLLHFALTD